MSALRAVMTMLALGLTLWGCEGDPGASGAAGDGGGAAGAGGAPPDGMGGTGGPPDGMGGIGGTPDGMGGAGGIPDGMGGAGGGEACTTTDDFIGDAVWPTVLQPVCSICHIADGPAGHTALLLSPPIDPESLAQTRAALEAVSDRIVLKPTGQHPDGHGGGQLLDPASPEALLLRQLAERLTGVRDDCGRLAGEEVEPPPVVPADCAEPPPGPRGLRRLSHVEYAHTIGDLLGLEVNPQAAFAADRVVEGYVNHAPSLTVTGLLADQYRILAEQLAEQADLGRILPCGGADRACATEFVTTFGRRLFRRPLTGEEAGRYLAIYDLASDEGFEAGVRWALGAMLQSPHFLYRTELGRRTDAGDFVLTPYELATELSYLVWQTTPDDALLDLAATGDLLDPAVLQRELERLMADGRSARTQVRFVERWLGLDQLTVVSREGLPDPVRLAMAEQTAEVVRALWTEGGDLTTLLTTDRTWLPPALAAHLELRGQGWVELSDTPYAGAGIMGHAGVLTTHAKPADSSPIHRGMMVRERLLCQPLPEPPANLDTSPPPVDPTLSTRERYTQHSVDPACYGCHNLVDPIGFALEHFDGLGRYRETEGPHAIDVRGEIVGIPSQEIEGLAGLASALAEREDVAHCYAEQWLRFGLGGGDELPLECYATHVAHDIAVLSDAMPAIVGLPRFTHRTGGEAELDVPGADLVPTEPGDAIEPPDPIDPPVDPEPDPPVEGVTPGAMLTVNENSRWETGYCVQAIVANTTDADLTWVVAHDVEGTINNLWNAEADGDSGPVMIRGVAWNATLPPGGQADFGWCAMVP